MKARWWTGALLACLLPALASAGAPPRKAMRVFDQMHGNWAATMRWGSSEERLPFLALQARAEVDDFSLRRWEQVRISGYRERSRTIDAEGIMRVRTEVAVINVHTQTERMVTVEERWQWLPEQGGWRLVSGLPALWPDA